MELSSEVYDLLERFKTLPKQNGECRDNLERMSRHETRGDDEIIHLEEIEFRNDETWLYGNEGPETATSDLHTWLHSDRSDFTADSFSSQSMKLLSQLNKTSPSKFIDSRTFTRPKKRYSRPSLEKYNEELFDTNSSENNPSLLAAKLQEMELDNDDSNNSQPTPLSFDLSQPTNTSIFEKILAEAPGIDSFQNMSPPSLVNSMCSSTFTTLMDSSFIRNDPVLREIRDTDYSETVLLQDSDPPMFQSITDSFCSDKGDTFIKRTLQATFTNVDKEVREKDDLDISDVRRQLEALEIQGDDSSVSLEENVSEKYISCEVVNEDSYVSNAPPSVQDTAHLKNIDMNSTVILSTTPPCLNGTYRRSPKQSNVTRNILAVSTDSLDDAYQHQHKDEIVQNTTFCKNSQNNPLNGTFSVDKRMSLMEHLNDERVLLNETYDYVVKRNSAGYSGGSADSLDRMSSISNNSSRGSSRMLNMAEVDAIVERQEQSLQVMSTPKPTSNTRKLCDSLHLSPILSTLERSDSDMSSSDEYVTGRTSFSKASPANSDSGAINYAGHTERSLKTVKSANAILQLNQKNPVRGVNTITKNIRPLQPASSYTTLQKKDTNLQKAGSNYYKGSQSNLRSVTSQLRGSYTSLKPVNKNLPEVTPPLNATHVRSSQGEANRTVKLTRNETFKVPLPVGDAQSLPVVKPLGRNSNLPRPVNTGIPRPVSRIPGPRAVKSVSSQPNVKQIRQLKDESYY